MDEFCCDTAFKNVDGREMVHPDGKFLHIRVRERLLVVPHPELLFVEQGGDPEIP